MTIDLSRRMEQHLAGAVPGFTRTYDVKRLVYYELHDDLTSARERERRLKRWLRDWKIVLIEQTNPDWSDLTPTLI